MEARFSRWKGFQQAWTGGSRGHSRERGQHVPRSRHLQVEDGVVPSGAWKQEFAEKADGVQVTRILTPS